MFQRSANTRIPPSESPYSTAASSAGNRGGVNESPIASIAPLPPRVGITALTLAPHSAATSSDRHAHSTVFAARHERRAEEDEHTERDVVLPQEAGRVAERLERHLLVQTREHFWMRRLETNCDFELPRDRISKTETALSIGAGKKRWMRLDDHALEPADDLSDLVVIVGRNGGRVKETAGVVQLDLPCRR